MNTLPTTAGAVSSVPTVYGTLIAAMSEDEAEKGTYADWQDDDITPCYVNVVHALKRAGITLAFDDFADDILIGGLPEYKRLDDHALVDLMIALQQIGLVISKDKLHDALTTIAVRNRKHHVRELFAVLEGQWDGTPRVEEWLIRHCRVKDTPYTRWLARAILLVIVRRVRQPGFPWKFVPTFEGAQSVGKTPVCRVLAMGKFHSDSLPIGAPPKEVIEQSANVLIFEFGELAGMTKRDVEDVKAFSSRCDDTARKAFGRTTTKKPRQFIGIATTNRQDYLKDETGNARFLPVTFNDDMDDGRLVDLEGLEAAMPQLYAEAATLERTAPSEWFYPSADILAAAAVEQKAREFVDGYDDALGKALEHVIAQGKPAYLPLDEALRACELDPLMVNKRDAKLANALNRALGKLGFKRERKWLVRAEDRVERVSGFQFGDMPLGRLSSWLVHDTLRGVCRTATGGVLDDRKPKATVQTDGADALDSVA